MKVNYPGPDPMFRQRLRNYWRDTVDQKDKLDPRSREWFKIDALQRALEAAYVELYREDLNPSHSAGETHISPHGRSPA
jgi:hypothetical protein